MIDRFLCFLLDLIELIVPAALLVLLLCMMIGGGHGI
jgi:hypothetical protein